MEQTIVPSGAFNGASFERGISPGMIGTVFTSEALTNGEVITANSTPLPLSLGGVSVSFMGDVMPVLAVARTQVNFAIRYGQFLRAFSVDVRRAGQTGSIIVATGGPVSGDTKLPGVFSYSGSREAIIVRNSDYSLADTLEPGVDYFLYATGLGMVSSPPALGDSAKAEPLSIMPAFPRITINGADCPVSFGGLAPGFVGVYQVNFRLGAGAKSGSQRLLLSIDGTVSNGNWVQVR
jgi:uncharacterized protein (TIGR03437 family)